MSENMINFYKKMNFAPGFEEIKKIFENSEIKIERICSNNYPSGPYNQLEDEWVMIIEGSAVLEIDGKKIELKKGDNIFIPKNTNHSVLKTSEKCLWLAVFIKNKDGSL